MPRRWARKVDRHGLVTIPADLRRRAGLQLGTPVVFTATKKGILVRTLRAWRKLHPGAAPPRAAPRSKGVGKQPR